MRLSVKYRQCVRMQALKLWIISVCLCRIMIRSKKSFRRTKTQIKSEVMADEITYDKAAGFTKEWSINGEKVMLGVEKM